jgi:nicotinate-nucleotide pyrophosphorylase (carboxylating)
VNSPTSWRNCGKTWNDFNDENERERCNQQKLGTCKTRLPAALQTPRPCSAMQPFSPILELDELMNEINRKILEEVVSAALDEDLGIGDLTTDAIVPPKLKVYGDFLAKEDLVMAGWPVVSKAFKVISPDVVVHANCEEGDQVAKGTIIGHVEGPAGALLKGERVSLNFLQQLSGVATETRKYVEAVKGSGVAILDTRKTTPGLRFLEKYAVRVGGGKNHRLGLYDGVLIKENHITVAGSVLEAVRRARQGIDHLKKIEVEVTNFQELSEVLEANVDVILLDNMTVEQVREAVRLVNGRVQLEVSGRVTLKNVREYAATGVNFISVGALTHSVKAVDISLELKLEAAPKT